MNICIVGWYGTETLGDRAILDGILAVFNQIAGEYTCHLGSLNPFFTERTLLEDYSIYKKTSPGCQIKLFDEKSTKEMREAVADSDYVIMGGGPIMDLAEMKFLIRAFKMARRRNKTTVLMGCGLGPLNTQKYQLCAKELIELSDKVIWRDEASAQMCNTMVERSDIYVLDDPAIISAQQYLKEKVKQKENYVAINFREFPNEYGQNKSLTIEEIRILLRKIAENHEVRLIPMHTFFIGGDDRDFFAEICDESIHEKVVVQYKPQNLHELYETYLNAQACIGMRYHSVVLQTILNGNNYIIDYTNPQNGKISGFLQYHMLEEKYEKKYFNLQNTQKWDLEECLAQLERGDCVEFPQIDSMERYCEIIKM